MSAAIVHTLTAFDFPFFIDDFFCASATHSIMSSISAGVVGLRGFALSKFCLTPFFAEVNRDPEPDAPATGGAGEEEPPVLPFAAALPIICLALLLPLPIPLAVAEAVGLVELVSFVDALKLSEIGMRKRLDLQHSLGERVDERHLVRKSERDLADAPELCVARHVLREVHKEVDADFELILADSRHVLDETIRALVHGLVFH